LLPSLFITLIIMWNELFITYEGMNYLSYMRGWTIYHIWGDELFITYEGMNYLSHMRGWTIYHIW
jgi:hypothetical protein